MWKIIIVLFFFELLAGNLWAISKEKGDLFHEIAVSSGKYLNCSYLPKTDSVLNMCNQAISKACTENNYIEKLKAEQLIINVFCLKGNIAQGIDRAKKMYEDAKVLNHSLGKALAIQSMGATYMYGSQYEQAIVTFSEATPVIVAQGDSLLQANLLVQRLHAYSQLRDSAAIFDCLFELELLASSCPADLKEVYDFHRICYTAVLQLQARQPDEAQKSLQELSLILPEDSVFDIWRYSLKAGVYQMLGKNDRALVYLDSTQMLVKQVGNATDYKNLLHRKAMIYEEIGLYGKSADMYQVADSLTNVLDMERYSKQIENLRVTYYVDQVAIENAQVRNALTAKILLYSFVCMLIAVVLILMARKRNKQLTLSRERLSQIRQVTADSIQSKSIFLSNMSHDLRTPLNAIVGFSEILTTTDDIDSEMKEQCRDYIKQNSDLLMKLVNDIVDFSTLKEAQIKFDFGKCDVVALCRNVVRTIANVKKTDAEVLFLTNVDKLEIETDSERLQQVLINLLTNAAKFTKEGYVRLRLEYTPGESKVTFCVEDTGCGIPLEKQPRIFERFEKLHESVQGVGLGLSICKLIVDHVGGEIWIDSAYTEGARFVFTHPVVVHKSK